MATQMISRELSGIQKASILIMSLGVSASSEIFKYLDDTEIESLTSEIMRTEGIDTRTRDAVLHECERRCARGGDAPSVRNAGPRPGAILELVAED